MKTLFTIIIIGSLLSGCAATGRTYQSRSTNQSTQPAESSNLLGTLAVSAAVIAGGYYAFKALGTHKNNNLVNVDGYYKSNGTFVPSYMRTAPNSTVTDNLSYKR
jgi:hypothetical protein